MSYFFIINSLFKLNGFKKITLFNLQLKTNTLQILLKLKKFRKFLNLQFLKVVLLVTILNY